MKNNIKLLIGMVIIILGIIMTIIALAMSTVVNKDSILEKNSEVILSNYTELTNDSGINIDLRKELAEKLDTFSNETYPEEHNSYIELLNKYNENIEKMAESVDEIHPRCDQEYEEPRINIICMSYNMLYEEAVNLYVKNLNNYNSKIEIYNQTSDNDYDKFEMLHKSYIDFDKDGVYTGNISED